MSDTPQNDDVINEEVNTVVEINDSAVASDTTTLVEGESEQQVDEVAIAQEKANAAFNKQYGEKKQLERDLAAQRAVVDKFEQAERERLKAQVGDIPPMPDAFDDDFDVKMKAHIDGVKAQERHNTNNDIYLQGQQFNQQQVANAKQNKVNESITTYTEKAKTLGIKPEELKQAADSLGQIGISLENTPDLVETLLADEDGPNITRYLAGNMQDAHSLLTMNPVQQAQFIERNVRAKANALKPKGTKAPAPADNLQGTTADFSDQQFKYIKGSEIDVGSEW